MYKRTLIAFFLMGILGSGCAPGQLFGPTITPSATPTLTPSPTQTPTETPTVTPVPPTETFTPTPVPQPLLLRRKCGRSYVVKANEPLQLFYGGWGVKGKELADNWATSLIVNLTIDDEVISGELQPPTRDLPYNCTTDSEDIYWLYYVVTIPGISPGEHHVRVTFSSLRALSDGFTHFSTGQLVEQTFLLITR